MSSYTEWNKTKVALSRLKNSIGWDFNNPYYNGIPVINRNSTVLGRVSLGEHPRGAIYVDPNSPYLHDLAEKVIDMSMEDGKINKGKILSSTYDIVKKVLPEKDIKKVESIYDYYDVMGDGLISLDVFLENGVGVCTQHTLTSAAILEILKNYGVIKGHPNVNRNSDYIGGKKYGHAWCRYTNSAGQVFILDSALGFKGSLEESIGGKWNYFRPDE